MICAACKARTHQDCPEKARQAALGLTTTEKAGSPWCDCQHVTTRPGNEAKEVARALVMLELRGSQP